MDQKRYQVFNTTRKAARVDPKTGKDLRSVRERVGHNISFRNEDGVSTVVTPGKFAITAKVNEGLLNLQRSGDCTIKPLKDITEVMNAHALAPDQHSRAARIEAGPTPAEKPAEPAPLFPDHVEGDRYPARAMEMGNDPHEVRGGRETTEAVNPDGEPNFLVKTKEISRNRPGAKRPQAGV